MGKVYNRQNDRLFWVAHGVPGSCFFKFHNDTDVSCCEFRNIELLVANHGEQLGGALFYAFAGIQDFSVRVELAGNNLHIIKASGVLINICFPYNSGKRFICPAPDNNFFGAVVRIEPCILLTRYRARGKPFNHVKKVFNADNLCCRAAYYRTQFCLGNECPYARCNLFISQCFPFKKFFNEFIITFCGKFNKACAGDISGILHVGGYVGYKNVFPVAFWRHRFHVNEINNTGECFSASYRYAERCEVCSKVLLDSFNNIKARAFFVHLVYKEYRGNVVCFYVPPCFFCFNLHTVNRIDNHNSGVGSLQRGTGFTDEVRHSRRVNDVYLNVVNLHETHGAPNGHLPVLFFVVIVRCEGTLRGISDLVNVAGDKKDCVQKC